MQEVVKTGKTDFRRDFKENSAKCKFKSGNNMARGAGFEPKVKPELLSVRVYNFLVSNGAVCLRDVCEALGEEPSRVDDCLRRLWKKDLILRTREPTFEFENGHRGRAGLVGYTRAINYYFVNNGHEVPSTFVSYEERKMAEAERLRAKQAKF